VILHVSHTSQQKKGRDNAADMEAICGGQFFFAMMISILYVGGIKYRYIHKKRVKIHLRA
jgi:hypothetical protein